MPAPIVAAVASAGAQTARVAGQTAVRTARAGVRAGAKTAKTGARVAGKATRGTVRTAQKTAAHKAQRRRTADTTRMERAVSYVSPTTARRMQQNRKVVERLSGTHAYRASKRRHKKKMQSAPPKKRLSGTSKAGLVATALFFDFLPYLILLIGLAFVMAITGNMPEYCINAAMEGGRFDEIRCYSYMAGAHAREAYTSGAGLGDVFGLIFGILAMAVMAMLLSSVIGMLVISGILWVLDVRAGFTLALFTTLIEMLPGVNALPALTVYTIASIVIAELEDKKRIEAHQKKAAKNAQRPNQVRQPEDWTGEYAYA